jgi:hypothetical protein
MSSPNWSNIKTCLNKTLQELRREVHNQISREIKRPYPANPKFKDAPSADQQPTVQQNQRSAG